MSTIANNFVSQTHCAKYPEGFYSYVLVNIVNGR